MQDHLFEDTERVGEYTAERLFSGKPEIYRACVSMTAEGIGVLRIAKVLGISPSSVLAVRRREGCSVEIEKQELSRTFRGVSRLCAEAMQERLDSPSRRSIPIRDLAIAAGVAADKAELLSGGLTARIGVTGDQAPTHQDMLEYLSQIRSLGMDSGGETGGQNGETTRVIGPGSGVDPSVPSGVPVDVSEEVRVDGVSDGGEEITGDNGGI